MLDLSRVDVADLAEALEDHSDDHSWYIDPHSGELRFRSEYSGDDDDFDPDEEDLVWIEPIGSGKAYGLMEDFVEQLSAGRERDLLERAIAGRGAFRRFKDTLYEFPVLRDVWFAFHDARMRRYAIEWLRDRELVTDADADRALTEIDEPPLPTASNDMPDAPTHEFTRDLYGWITHTDFASTDPAATRSWCESVLGWSFRPPFPAPTGDYHLFAYSEQGGGGIRQTAADEAPGATPTVHVADTDATYEAALAAGANGVQPPTTIMDGVRVALVRAPGGIVIGFSGPTD